jgi:formate dehydrogenase subunit gamma
MFRIIVLVGIAATVVALAGHYVVFGPKRVSGEKAKRTVRRFSLWERFVHVVTVLGFLTLAVTGLIAVIFQQSPLHGWLWIIHVGMGPVFVTGLSLLVVTWARDVRFAPYDWEWVKKLGGYLWGDKHALAERFNAGQKAYLWCVALLGFLSLVSGLGRVAPILDATGQEVLYQVHRYTALVFILAGIVHLYLGTLANPGTFGAMLTGKVTQKWAETHHPLWGINTGRTDDEKRNSLENGA